MCIRDSLKEGKILSFAHGFNIRFGLIKPPSFVDVVMIAPKGPGHTVRWEYQNGQGVPVGVAQPSILIDKMTVGGTKL